MVFLLLGVVLAAMILSTVNRPQILTLAPGGTEQAAGTGGSVSAPSIPPADAGRGDNAPMAEPAPAESAPTPAPETGLALLPPSSPPTPSAPTPTETPATPPAAPDVSAAAPDVATPPASSGDSDTLALRVPSGAGAGTPVPSRPVPPAVPAGGPRNLEMTTAPRATTPTAPGAPQTQPQVDPAAEHTLAIMALRFSGQGMILTIQADDAFTCRSFALSGPDRLVVDLGGTWTNMRAPMVPDNTLVTGARTGRQERAARLVLDLSRPLKQYETVRISPAEVEIHME
jgi:hypothetical protein